MPLVINVWSIIIGSMRSSSWAVFTRFFNHGSVQVNGQYSVSPTNETGVSHKSLLMGVDSPCVYLLVFINAGLEHEPLMHCFLVLFFFRFVRHSFLFWPL